MTHAELVDRAVAWLKRQSCSVILHEPFRTPLSEQPDAIGWRDGLSILLEAKTSIADFRVDAAKPWRRDPTAGVGDWRFYIAPAGLLSPLDLPEGWGLIECVGKRSRVVSGGPKGNHWWGDVPFRDCDKRAETRMLVSALSRPEARPKPAMAPRRGIDVAAWLNGAGASEAQPVEGGA